MADTAKIYYRRHSKSGEDVDDKFDVEVSKGTKGMLIAVFVAIIIGMYLFPLFDGADTGLVMEWWAPIVFIALTAVPILLWGKIGPNIAQGIIVKWLKKVSEKKKTSPAEFFIGFPMRVKDPYFIEANPVDFDVKNARVFMNRVKEVIFLSIGISILISQTVLGDPASSMVIDQMAKWGYLNNNEMIIYSAIFLGPLALIVLFFVMPLMWISEDMQIYRIDDLQDPYRVGFYLRGGMLSKILGFFGIVLAFNVSNDFATAYYASADAITVYLWTFIYFFFILISCAGFPYLCSYFYLLFFHKEWVNKVRIKASEFLPSATTQVNYVEAKELTYLTHPEKLAEFDRPDFSDKMQGKVIIGVLTVVCIIMSIWLAFLY